MAKKRESHVARVARRAKHEFRCVCRDLKAAATPPVLVQAVSHERYYGRDPGHIILKQKSLIPGSWPWFRRYFR